MVCVWYSYIFHKWRLENTLIKWGKGLRRDPYAMFQIICCKAATLSLGLFSLSFALGATLYVRRRCVYKFMSLRRELDIVRARLALAQSIPSP